jgi:hypothetical protein
MITLFDITARATDNNKSISILFTFDFIRINANLKYIQNYWTKQYTIKS